MNKLITKIVGVALGLTMTVGVGVALGVNGRKAVPVEATAGDVLAQLTPSILNSNNTYGRYYNKTDDYGIKWSGIGNNAYFGINSAANNTGQKAGVNAYDLPVAKAVDANATSSTSTSSNSCTGYYVYCTATAITNAGSIEFAYTANSGNNSATGYVVYNDTATSTSGTTWSLIPLAASSAKQQGASLGTSGTFVFTFNATQTSAKYYGFVIATSSFKRMTGATLTIKEGATSTPSFSADSSVSVKKGQSTTIDVSYTNMASGLTISATSSDTSIATVTASRTTSSGSGTASFTVNGVSEGSTTITFDVTYSGTPYSATSNVDVYELREFQKITKLAELNTTRAEGGRYVIASSSDNTIVMSTSQGGSANNRGFTTSTFEDDVMMVPTITSIAVINIVKSGDYYTLYDIANEGYYYGVSSNNHLKISNPATKTDYYYWSISFSDGHSVFTNKGSSYTIRFNSTNTPNIFSTYNTGQVAVDLYEFSEDVPVSVALTSLTADDASVHAGSVLTYTASYLPANATEGIVVTGSNDAIATVDSYSMSNGTLTVTITGVAVGSISLSMVGENVPTNVNETVTITVNSYTATHDLVTSASSLINGSRVVIGCTEDGFNYIAERSTGGTNLNAVAAGFSADKTTLAAESENEFVAWCVDSVNGYYVFSDGGYYLASPTGKNNYLVRSDTLNEACYFTIDNNADGVVVKNSYGVNHEWKDVTSPYTIEFNSSTSKFSLYGSVQKSASLYVSKQAANVVQGYVDAFMHFGNVSTSITTDTGACLDDGKGYFAAALTAYNQLTSAQKETFCTDPTYSAAYARLSAWAAANEYSFNSYSLEPNSSNTLIFVNGNNANIATVVAILATIGAMTLGGYFFLRRRKERN